jgi:putative transcriptional regulator
MQITIGKFLKSTPEMDDPNFEETIIFITEHNEKGTIGFVVNKLFPRSLNALVEFQHSIAFPLYAGGPVEEEHLFFVHCRPDLITGGTIIKDAIYLGGHFKEVITGLNNNTLTENDVKIFVGYCGWDFKQLAAEIEEGSWLLEDKNTLSIFSSAY